MFFGMYTIMDSAAGQAGPVFNAVNDLVATRAYRITVSESVTPQDYKLFRIGQFDDETMEVKPVVNPVEVFVEVKNEKA